MAGVDWPNERKELWNVLKLLGRNAPKHAVSGDTVHQQRTFRLKCTVHA